MKFIYEGSQPTTKTWGYDFVNGEPTEVEGAHVIEKLRGNPYFKEVRNGNKGGNKAKSSKASRAAGPGCEP